MSNQVWMVKRTTSNTGVIFTTAMPCYVMAETASEALEIARATKKCGTEFTHFEINKHTTYWLNNDPDVADDIPGLLEIA